MHGLLRLVICGAFSLMGGTLASMLFGPFLGVVSGAAVMVFALFVTRKT